MLFWWCYPVSWECKGSASSSIKSQDTKWKKILKLNINKVKLMTTQQTGLESTMKIAKWWIASTFYDQPSTVKE